MKGMLNWSGVELQIETLVPGVIVVAELGVISGSLPSLPPPLGIGFTTGVVLVALSYGVGALLIAISRLIVDAVSERGPRALVFRCLAHGDREDLLAFCQRDPKSKVDYESEKLARSCETIAAWNVIYRWAVRTSTRREEVDRRRAQGRLLRALFIPTVVAVGILCHYHVCYVLWKWDVTAFGCILAAVVMIFLYAYTELTVFAEAYDVSLTVEGQESDHAQSHPGPDS